MIMRHHLESIVDLYDPDELAPCHCSCLHLNKQLTVLTAINYRFSIEDLQYPLRQVLDGCRKQEAKNFAVGLATGQYARCYARTKSFIQKSRFRSPLFHYVKMIRWRLEKIENIVVSSLLGAHDRTRLITLQAGRICKLGKDEACKQARLVYVDHEERDSWWLKSFVDTLTPDIFRLTIVTEEDRHAARKSRFDGIEP